MDDPFKIPEFAPKSSPVVDPRKPRATRAPGSAEGTSFKNVLSDAVGEVQRLQNDADTAIKKLVSG